jgi:hypothetical protein
MRITIPRLDIFKHSSGKRVFLIYFDKFKNGSYFKYSRSTLVWLNKIQVERLHKNIVVGVDNVFKGNCVSLLFYISFMRLTEMCPEGVILNVIGTKS